jgi:hypothetical protein
LNSSLIRAEFWKDFVAFIKQQLVKAGMLLDGTESDEKILIAYYNRAARELLPRPRSVHTPKDFSVLAEHQSAIADIRREIESGVDLSPRLSKRIKDWEYVDKMLADFGIHHLHLGNTIEADGFVTRGGPLLYARFDPGNAYFLAILGHNEWTNPDLIEIIHANWPETIARLKIPALGLQYPISAQDRKELRKANIDAPIELKDGTIYGSLGGGVSSDGTPTVIAMRIISTRRLLRKSEKLARETVEARLSSSPPNTPVTIALEIRDGRGYAVEPITALDMRLW